MNNRGQNVNPNGVPQNHHPNQGYPQQNNQYQGNGYNGQNPQNFNRNVNNQNPYQNQNSQANNVNNSQFQGYSNGQNQPHNNMNNPQFNNQNGYKNPNQFNLQFGNNQNSNPMNRRSKMDGKMIGYITAAVAAIVVVLMIFMFSSSSGKLGGATPEEAVRNYIAAIKDGDVEKMENNFYFESDEARSKAKSKTSVEFNNLKDTEKKDLLEYFDTLEIVEVKLINENRAEVELKAGGKSTHFTYVKKVNGRWFIEGGVL